MPELLFYEKAVALDRDVHRRHRLKPAAASTFAAQVHIVPVLASEFADASREYVLAFVRNEGNQSLHAVAILGARAGQNLYLDADGNWDAVYIPAFIRRYPFVLAQTGEDQYTLCIDERFAGLNTDEGERLFDDQGEPTTFLNGAFALTQEFHRVATLTEAFLSKLDAAGLLAPSELGISTANGERVVVNGFLAVDQGKFQQLPEATLKEWFASGELGLLYAHLASLGNVHALARRLSKVPVKRSKKSRAA